MSYEEQEQTVFGYDQLEEVVDRYNKWKGVARSFILVDLEEAHEAVVERVEAADFGPHAGPDGEGPGFVPCESLFEVFFYVRRIDGVRNTDSEDGLWMVNAATLYVLGVEKKEDEGEKEEQCRR